MAARDSKQEIPAGISVDPDTGEAWYPIPTLPGYEISSDLRVRGWLKGGTAPSILAVPRIKSTWVDAHGYIVFNAKLNGRFQPIKLHRVVAELAYGPIPPGTLVLHRNDDKTDNRASNLYFGNHAENAADAIRNRVHPMGESAGGAKLTAADVREIRDRHAGGASGASLARAFGVCESQIGRICRGERWAHLAADGQ